MADEGKQVASYEYDNVEQSIFCFDKELRYTYVNRLGLELLGLTEDEVIGHPYNDVYPDDRDSIFIRSYKRGLETNEIIEFDYTSRFTSKEFHCVVMPTSTGITVMMRDATQLAVTRQDPYAKSLMENPQIGFMVLKNPDKISFINERGLSLLGISPGAIDSVRFTEMFEPTVRSSLVTPLNNIFFQPNASYNFDALIKTNSQPRWISGILTNLSDNPNFRGILYIFYDSDELKNQEIAGRKLGYSLDKDFEIAEDPALVIRRQDGIAIAVNQKFLTLLNITREQIIGANALNLIEWEDQNSLTEFNDKVSRRINIVDLPIRLLSPNGEHVQMMLNATALSYEGVDIYLATIRKPEETQSAFQPDLTPFTEGIEELRSRAEAREQELATARERADKIANNSKVLYDVARYLLEYESEHIGLTQVAEMIAEGFHYDRVAIILFDTHAEQVTGFFRGGKGKAYIWRTPYHELFDGLTGWVIRNNESAISPKGYIDPRESTEVFSRRNENLAGAILVAPIFIKKQVIGTITVINRFDEPDILESDRYLIESIAGQISTALRNINLVQSLSLEVKTHQQTQQELRESRDELDKKVIARTVELTRSNRSLELISECNDIIKMAEAEKSMLEEITRSIVTLGGYKHCWVARISETDTNGFHPCAISDKSTESVEPLDDANHNYYFNFSPMVECVRDRMPIIIHDLTASDVYPAWKNDALDYHYRSVCCLPIIVDDQLFGAMMISHEAANMFDQTHIDTLKTILKNITMGISSFRARREAKLVHERFELSFHNNPGGNIIVKIPEGTIVDVNDSYLSWTGFSRGELVGKNARIFRKMSSDTAFRKLMLYINHGGEINDLTIPFTNRNGENKIILLSGREISINGERHAIFIALDVTEKEQFSRELNELRGDLLAAEKLALMGSWRYDIATQNSKWSPQLYVLLGFSPDEPVPHYDALLAKTHPDDRKAWLDAIHSIQKTKQPSELIYRYEVIPGSGEYHYFEGLNEPILNAEGEVYQTRGTIQDVTAEIQIRRNLQDTRKKLEVAQAFAQVGNWEFDFDANLFTGSDQCYEIFEWDKTRAYTMKEFLGRAYPADLKMLKGLWHSARNGESYDVEHRIVTESGIKWVHIVGAGELSDPSGKVKFVGSMQDITKRKVSELAADQRDNQLRRFIEFSPLGESIIDNELRFATWNSALVELTGLTAEEVIGKPAVPIIHVISGADEETRLPIDMLTGLLNGMVTQGNIPEGFSDWIQAIYHKDGTTRRLHMINFLIPEGDHFLIGTSYQDVTKEEISSKISSARLRLIGFADGRSQIEIVREALNILEELLESSFSYFNNVRDDRTDFDIAVFSDHTLETCAMDQRLFHFPLLQGKLWTESVNTRRTIVHNSIPPSSHFPAGHNPMRRVMFIPVIRNNNVVAIAGVANKLSIYSDQDVTLAEDFLNVAYDIIDRSAQTEEAERLRALVSNSKDLVATLDVELNFDYINPAGRAMLGFSKNVTLPDIPLERVLSDASSLFLRNQALPSLEINGFWTGELGLVATDGTPLDVFVSLSRASRPDLSGYGMIAADMSQLKETESKLRLSQQRAEALLSAVPDMIFRLDRDNVFFDYKGPENSKLLEQPSEFIGKNMLEVVPGQLGNDMLAKINLARKTGDIQLLSYSMPTPSGDGFFEVRYQANPENMEVIAVVRDITDLHNSLEELRIYKNQLENMVADRTAQLELARDQAQTANRAKSDFLAMMSHEIRTPMNGVLGLTELLRNTELTNQQQNYLEHIKISGEQLLSVINDILDFSKIEAEKLEISPEEFDLDELLFSLTKTVGFLASEKGLELLFSCPPEIPRNLFADDHRLKQVLLNLTSNAIKFTEKGTVKIEIKRLAQSPENVTLEFAVIDTGIGMTAEQTQKIFQPFIQVESANNRRFDGTGLGLVISQRIIKLMGGAITVKSKPKHGSTFTFTLTIPLSANAENHKWYIEPDLHDLKVIVADADGEPLNFLVAILNSFSFITTPIHNYAGVKTALSEREKKGRGTDLLMISTSLPGLEGTNYIERAREQFPNMPIILLTPQGITRVDENEVGVDGVIEKPYIASSILDTVMNVFSKKREDENKSKVNVSATAVFEDSLVLLVEDNLVNQLVAEQVLIRMGLRVIIANDGKQCLKMAEKEPIDLVLMDIQMPEMDGYEATRLLRERKGNKYANLPIIAMTAHALSGERDKVLAVGMNDYLTKPIDVTQLRRVLAKWLRARSSKADDTDGRPQLAAAVPSKLDVGPAVARLGNDTNTYKKVLQLFLSDHISDADVIRQHLLGKDVEAAGRVAHTLKGVAGTVGAQKLVEQAIAVEKAIKESRLSDVESLLLGLESELAETSILISDYLRNGG